MSTTVKAILNDSNSSGDSYDVPSHRTNRVSLNTILENFYCRLFISMGSTVLFVPREELDGTSLAANTLAVFVGLTLMTVQPRSSTRSISHN